MSGLPLEDEKLINSIVGGIMEDKKFQFSMFDKARNRQYVIRCEDEEEFDILVEKYTNKLEELPTNSFPDDSGPVATPPAKATGSNPVCSVHGSVMVLKPAGVSKAGKQYPAFYSCPTRNPDGSFCNFKPREVV